MELTQKIRIFPIDSQKKILWDLSEKCRLIYNFALAERNERWKQNKNRPKKERTYINYTNQQDKLPEIKKKYPEYMWVYSKVLQMTLRKLDADYKSFLALWKNGYHNARPPRFKNKRYFTTFCYNQSGFRIIGSVIEFSHKHPSKENLSFEVPEKLIPKKKIKQVEIFLDSLKRWFISIIYEINIPKYKDNGLYQAFDLGVSQTTGVNIHGKTILFKHRRVDKYWKNKLKNIQSKRDHCKKASIKWIKYNQKLRKMKQKQANQLKDYQHWLSNHIIQHTKANTIIIGELEVKQMAQKTKGTGSARKIKAQKTLHYSVHNTGFMGRFAEFLTYKAAKIGKKIIRIGEEMTTKACCKCGKLEKRTIYERTIDCDCGNQLDRDVNSAINIMVKFINLKQGFEYDFLSQEPSVDEELFLQMWKGFLRHTTKLTESVSADS